MFQYLHAVYYLLCNSRANLFLKKSLLLTVLAVFDILLYILIYAVPLKSFSKFLVSLFVTTMSC